MARINLIYARSANGVIGKDGVMPWHLPEDLAHFKQLTHGCPVIMGRKTWDSLPPRFRPLPGRANIVITRDKNYRAEGVLIAASLDAALDIAAKEAEHSGAREIAVIGGSAIFAETLPRADRIELTEVHARPEGDVTFPAYAREQWRELRREGPLRGPNDEHAYSIVTLERR